MSKHVYLRAYMAGVTIPSVLMVFALASFCVVRIGYHFPFPIERAMVFPLALVPPIWGLWNMLYVALRRHRYLPLGLHGAVVPLFLGPLGFATIRTLGFEIPPLVAAVFPFFSGSAANGVAGTAATGFAAFLAVRTFFI